MAMTKADGSASSVMKEGQATTPSAQTSSADEEPYPEGTNVRVWWPPTTDKNKTEFSGMYWPVKILARAGEGLKVQYDNGEIEVVSLEHIHPAEPPVDFGSEILPLQVGEFVEVFNQSKHDPAAWLAKVYQENRETYEVEYPFHDTPNESVKVDALRRARIFEKETQQWKIIKPNQIWDDGEIESPLELETWTPKEMAQWLQKHQGAAARQPSPVKRKGIAKKTAPGKPKPTRGNLKAVASAGASKRKGKPQRART